MHEFGPLQVASQEHASAQRTRLHAPSPEHVTMQAPVPQRTSSAQLALPTHSISQSVAIRQST